MGVDVVLNGPQLVHVLLVGLHGLAHHGHILEIPGHGIANGIATFCNTIIMMQHQKRRFMEKIDYITSCGWMDGPGGREKVGGME